MSEPNYRQIVPFPILIVIIIAAVLTILLWLDLLFFSVQEKDILKKIIVFLSVSVFFYFLFRPFAKRSPVREKPAASPRSKFPPEGFILRMAENEKFSFCYPKNWEIVAPADPSLYLEAREIYHAPNAKFLRNFNLSSQDISRLKDMEFLFQAIVEGVLNFLPNGRVEFRQRFTEENMTGMRYRIDYRNNDGLNLCCYQVAITTLKKRTLLIYTFTTETFDFENSRPLFDQIVNLTKIID